MGFRLKSGNTTSFKNMGGTEQSPAKAMATHKMPDGSTMSGASHKSAPAKQKSTKGGEGKDQDKILDDKGNHIGNWVNDKKVMFNDEQIEDAKGVTTNIKMPKVMKDGYINPTQKAKIAKEGARYDALADKQKKEEQDAANAKAKAWRNSEEYKKRKSKSPAKQTKDTFDDGSKKSSRDKFNDTETAIEQRNAEREDNQKLPKPNFKIHSYEVDLNKKSGFGPVAKNNNLTRKQKATSKAEMKGIDSNSAYWYKIDGKTVNKKAYLEYENKPGNMEGGGKQTNHPDVYGRMKNNHGRGPKTK